MTPPKPYTDADLKRIRLYALVFIIIGLGILAHGSLSLISIYHQESMILLPAQGLSPEKGRMWVECLTGISVFIIGLALLLKTNQEKTNT